MLFPIPSALDDSPEQPVHVPAGRVVLDGTLTLPPAAVGIVLFAHGSGSSRFSPRNRYVAQVLRSAGLGTLLIDLLTVAEGEAEVQGAELRFDIALLAERLIYATDWLHDVSQSKLPLGYFGASTGGGAALVAAAERPALIGAVVSRGGRPDLAGSALPSVRAPTLLIVGGADSGVIALNLQAMERLRAPHRLAIVPGAGHLFEEPGALDEVAVLASGWFRHHLGDASGSAT